MPSVPVRPAPVPLWLLALITLSGTLGMHIFVPALPFAAESLGAGVATIQLTVTVYIAGLAIGQLVYGPLADRYGRRPVLMCGLALYALAGLAAAWAPGVGWLIAARLVQALGGCAGLVIGRTIVRDTASHEESARRLALLNVMVVLGPGLAPIAGSLLADSFGWRSILQALALLGIVNLVFSAWLLPETRTAVEGAPPDTRALVRIYGQLLKSPAFIGFSIGGGCATTSMYAFIAAAPFIFVHQLDRPVHEVGFYLAVLMLGVWTGSALAARLLRAGQVQRLLRRANAAGLLAALVLLAAAATGHLGVPVVVGSTFVFTLCAGLAAPAALTEAISVDRRVTGSAAGLYGATQMTVGALSTALVGLGSNPALSAALVLVGASLLGQAAFWAAQRDVRRRRLASA